MIENPPLNALAAFEAAARLGSFTRAGEELCVTQAAISQHIRHLEEYLGVPLFIRRTPGIRLTPDGERLRLTAEALELGYRHSCIPERGYTVLEAVFAPQVIAFFRDDPQVIDIGTRAFRYQCISLPLGAVLVFANMLFQSVGKYWRASFLAMCRQGLFFIPLVFFLPARFGLTGLEITQTFSDLIAFAISASMLLYYFLKEFRQEVQRAGQRSI